MSNRAFEVPLNVKYMTTSSSCSLYNDVVLFQRPNNWSTLTSLGIERVSGCWIHPGWFFLNFSNSASNSLYLSLIFEHSSASQYSTFNAFAKSTIGPTSDVLGLPVWRRICASSATERPGSLLFKSAHPPATIGAAMLVPSIKVYLFPGIALNIRTPGAETVDISP